MMKYILMTAVLIGVGWPTTASHADDYTRMFPDTMEISGVQMERKGISKLTVRLVFDVYVAAFYQLAGYGPDDALADVPRHLEIHYLRNISSTAFIDAGDDMLSAQHSSSVIESIRTGMEQINALYQDVRKGDRYSLTYIPGTGTELKRNGESKGIIPGEEFARVYFTIWLGKDNPYKPFRDRLVGLR